MMTRFAFLLAGAILWILPFQLSAQLPAKSTKKAAGCPVAFDETDPFDSLRTVGSQAFDLGQFMASLYEEADGPRFIPEGKAMYVFSQNDTLSGVFFHLALPEYNYHKVDLGFNVKVQLANDTILALYTIPDRGTFDKSTNMRVYQHTALVPMDQYYLMTVYPIKGIRIEYPEHRRTIFLTEKQGKALLEAARCVGERAGMYPITP